MKDHYKYVIIGGGVGTGYACSEFVKHDLPKGELLVISADSVPPYERPALTKAYLHPPEAQNRASLPGFHTPAAWGEGKHTEQWYQEQGIDLELKTSVTNVDLQKKTVETDQNKTVTFEKLIIGTGARPVKPSDLNISGGDLQNVFSIRSIDDASALVKTLESKSTKKPVIIGGGYIGMECAAGISGWKHIEQLYMIFPESRLLERLFPERVAEWFESKMKERNIYILKGLSVSEIFGSEGKVSGVKLSNGQTIEADMVIAGIGAKPKVELFKGQLDLAEDGGLKVDSQFQTSVKDVYALGDVASFPNPYGKGHVRFEHVDNGRRSATHLVQCLLEKKKEPYNYTPYFYSRLFEYTDSPLIFRLFGENVGPNREALRDICFQDKSRIGVFWVDQSNKIFGAMMCNGSEENYNEMEKIAKEQPKLQDESNPASMLSSW